MEERLLDGWVEYKAHDHGSFDDGHDVFELADDVEGLGLGASVCVHCVVDLKPITGHWSVFIGPLYWTMVFAATLLIF